MMFLESRRLLVVILALVVGSFVFYGVAVACGGHNANHQHDADKPHDHGKSQDSNKPQEPNKPLEQTKVAEQTTCPVMGGAINKEIFTTYKGKKVYFCCSGCKPKFESNPDKYIEKVPQFGKKQISR